MKRTTKLIHVMQWLLLCVGLLSVASCATRSPSPRLYVFAPKDDYEAAPARAVEDSAFIVYLSLPRLSPYLDRPHIVTRLSDHEIEASPFHRWGIPLDIMIREMMADSINHLLPDAYVEATARQAWSGPGYRVQTDIIRLDGVPGGEVKLIAQWEITRVGEESEPLTKRLRHYRAQSADTSYGAYVNAIRNTIAALGADVGGQISTFDN